MAKVSENDILNMSQDWGQDPATGLPFSGSAVQKFIKEQLNSKGGCFYKDVENNRYLVFASENSKDDYLLDPTKTELILGMFDIGSEEGEKYTAIVNLSSPMYNTIQLGAKGNYINFTFDVLNASDLPTGEPVMVTFKISRGSSKTEVKEIHRYGSSVSFNLDNYLGEGTNIISITITGQISLATTTVAVTYNVVNLSLSDSLDISKVYDLSGGKTASLVVPYEISGSYTKIMEWYIDGVQLEFNRTDDEVLETVPVSRSKTIELSNLSQGRHSLQFRAGSKINGETFYSETLYRDFFVFTGANEDLMLGVALSVPSSKGILTDGNTIIHDMVQYVSYSLKVASYSPVNAARTEIKVLLDSEPQGLITSKNGLVTPFSIVPSTEGSKTLKLEVDGVVLYSIPTTITASDMNISEITNNLELNFSARGKNNNSSDKDSWSGGSVTASLTGFKWNNQSGWVDNRLEISKDAELHINFAPLADHSNGKTLEFEWSSKNVSDENAILCDLRNSDGTGILITASAVTVTSANKVSIERRYKSDENVRLSVVINPNRGTNKGLTLIYVNGIISGAVNVVPGDSYSSDKDIIFRGSEGACVSLKQILVYNTALSTEQEYNNFTLYRDSVAEMLEVYNRNLIYDGIAYDATKMASRLPVMIVTGEIPTLENTNDKDTQIIVDIEYINMQDTTRSFTMKNAAMRPQGTSSMGYPKKNFRIYTQKIDSTVLEVNGHVVDDKLYSFKANATPVNCWCLKADYAESSGTHNTGIARMWGDAFKNAQVTVDLGEGNPHNVDNEYVLRTQAQQKAIDNGYPYDVRTTIDGLPILLFYRRTANSDIIFLGKYNFNNDKSTEAVFGFNGIPGFDNSRMQCWEVLNNGNPIGLFTDISDFYNDVFDSESGKTDKGWKFAFESRYPDTKTPKTNDLYFFASWVNRVNGDHTRFAEEKWDHLDVYKVAGYYCYLNRHGAADQFVKNAMLTSEDGIHFYFILYDNDTINGLNNTGDIAILPTDNRESVYANGSHKFAGYDSVLWNMLEADSEFMEIVRAVDNALYSAGISYANAIKIFDEEQADKWVERVYNLDAEYKYISPYTTNGTNNLFMLQGKRDIHRKWFLANRFSLYDSLFVSGAYKSGYVEIKCTDETMPTQQFKVTSGYPIYFGYGINGKLRQRTEIPLTPNSEFTFSITEKVNLGDPIAIYGAPNIKALDLSPMTDRISVLQLAGVYDSALGTKLEVLKVGSSTKENITLKEISGIKSAKALTHLDVRNVKGLTALDLSENVYLKELVASGTNIASVSFAQGAPIEHLVLPASFRTVQFNSLPSLMFGGIEFADISNVSSFEISSCPNLSNDFAWVYDWYCNKSVENKNAVLHMDDIAWTDVDPDSLADLKNIGSLQLKGTVRLSYASQEVVDRMKTIFGETIFNKSSEFCIQAPDGVYLSGPSKLLEGESAKFVVAAFSEENGRIQFSLPTSRQGCSIDATSGRLTTTENGLDTSDIVVRAVFITDSGKIVDTTMNVTIEKRSYPTAINIEGNALVSEEISTFTLTTTPAEVTGLYRVDWTLGDASAEYLTIKESNNTTCVIKRIKEGVVETTLTATMVKLVDGTTTNTVTKNISLVLPGVVITKSSNAPLQECLYQNGLVAHEDYSEAWELALITADQLQPGTSSSTSIFYSYINRITSLSELKHFTGLTRIKSYTFSMGSFTTSSVKTIELPDSIEFIEEYAFNRIANLEKIVVPNNVVVAGNYAFYNTYTDRLYIPNLEKWANSVYSYHSNLTKEDGSTKIFVENFEKEVEEVDFDFPVSYTTVGNGRYNFFNWKSVKKWIISHPDARVNFSGTTGDLYINVNISGNGIQRPLGDIYIGENVTSILGDFAYTPTNNVHIDTLEHWFSMDFDMARSNPLGGDYSLYVGDSEVPEDIIIPDSITEVKSYALNRWNKPKSVRFHKDVTSISDVAINLCTNIEQLVVDSNNKKYDSRENCNAVIESAIGKLILGCINTHLVEGVKILVTRSFTNIVPETLDLPISLENIEGDVFKQSRTLKNINIHSLNTWVAVGHRLADSFYAHRSLYLNGELIEDFIIPDGIEKVNNSIFNGIVLKSITIPSSVKEAKAICIQALIEKLIIKRRRSYLAFSSNSFSYCISLRELYVDDLETYLYCSHGSSGGYSFFSPLSSEAYSETKLFVNGELVENLILTSDLYNISKNNGTSWQPIFRNIGSIKSVYVEKGWNKFESHFLSGCVNVKTIIMEINNVIVNQDFTTNSNSFGSSNTTYTGRNTYNTGENILYVPQGATGYDVGYWLDPLQNSDKCGFVISYTL